MAKHQSEQERSELHAKIWKIADELRGAVDGWDFKSFVITAMFYRFLSESLTDYVNAVQHKAGDSKFDYAALEDGQVSDKVRKLIIETLGYFIAPSELFCNVLRDAQGNSLESEGTFFANSGKKRTEDDALNVRLNAIFKHIEESAQGTSSADDFKGLFSDFDANSPKLGNTFEIREKKLLAVLNGVDAMDLKHSNNKIDAFGDAYEYLMAMYASNAGKSGGEFFTPQEVSELLARLAAPKKSDFKAYDPACGSGSLLLQVRKVAEEKFGSKAAGLYYGQEINLTTYNLCRINMILHRVNFTNFDIRNGDTLIQPSEEHLDKAPFDVVVSNPPYSTKWEGKENPLLISDPRFSPAGVLAPSSKADLAFVMHCLAMLAESGTAAIVCFPGIMYRGGAEQKIRKYLIEGNYVDAVIQLPSNLFFGTGIATCIMVLKRSRTTRGVLFVDASGEFVKVTNNNKLTPENIERISEAVANPRDQEYFARVVPREEIAENDYNLSVSSYVEQEDTREVVDIVELNKEIASIVAREEKLRKEIDRIIVEIAKDGAA